MGLVNISPTAMCVGSEDKTALQPLSVQYRVRMEMKEELMSFPDPIFPPVPVMAPMPTVSAPMPSVPPLHNTDYQRFDFIDMTKQDVLRVLISGEAEKVDIPAKYTRDCDPDRRIRAITIQGILAPFLLCDECGALYQWYKLVNSEWKNQSGIKSMKLHIKKLHDNNQPIQLPSAPTTGGNGNGTTTCPSTSVGKLGGSLHDEFRACAVQQVVSHPNISFTAAAQLISTSANFAAKLTHRTSKLYDFSISRSDINNHLVHTGMNASQLLLSYYKALMADIDVFPSIIIDNWSARSDTQAYGGLVICGLDRDWSWFSFPLRLEQLMLDSQYNFFTQEWFLKSIYAEEFRQAIPIAVTTTDDPNLQLGFDGRNDMSGSFSAERFGCVEFALSESISQVLEERRQNSFHVDPLLNEMKAKLAEVECFYQRECFLDHLRLSKCDKSTTTIWRIWHNKLTSVVNNYSFYSEESHEKVVNNLQPLAVYKSVLEVLQDCKDFFDIFEKDGPNSHLSFLSYIMLDVKVFSKAVGISATTTDVSQTFAADLLRQMEKHLWPHCGSSFALTAATLSGLDLVDKISSLTESVCRKVESNNQVSAEEWMAKWMDFSSTIEDKVKQYINNIVSSLSENTYEARASISAPDNLLSELFESTNPPKRQRTCSNDYETELTTFKNLKVALQNPVIFFSSCGSEFSVLKKVAKYVLSVRVSSGRIDSLFNNCGLVIRKMRRKMKLNVVRSIVYNNVCQTLLEEGMIEKYNPFERDTSKLNVTKEIRADSSESDSD